MIVTFFIEAIAGLIILISSILPDVPAMPTAVTDAGTTLTNLIVDGWEQIGGFLGTPFLIAMTVLVIGIFNFEHIYHLSMWVIRKLPIGAQ